MNNRHVNMLNMEIVLVAAFIVYIQEEIFNYVGRPTIETCMYGYNGTVFA